MWDEKKLLKALFFAFEAHREQAVKYPEVVPYTAHLLGVLQFAIKGALKDNIKKLDWDLMVCSAILHDVIEDTNVSFDMIEQKFGKEVADGVLALSKNDNLPKSERMKDSIERIKNQPREIAIVKLADRLMNSQYKIPFWTDERIKEYILEAKYILNELGYANVYLKNELNFAIENFPTVIDF